MRGGAAEDLEMANPETLLPPGFRFHPTDEELIQHYLKNQATSLPCPVSIIAEVDIYKFDPWDLPAKAMFGDKEWYFFSPRDRKYPNGVRPNRAAASGYWKATGTDKPILAGSADKENIGVKKALVFYTGKPPKGIKTDWIMHEYRLVENQKHGFKRARDSSMRLDDWVLCRIYKKSNNQPGSPLERESEASTVEKDVHLRKNASLGDLFNDSDFSVLARLLHENPSGLDQPYDGGGIFSLLSPESPAAKRQSTPPEFDRYGGEPTSYPFLPHHLLFDSQMGFQ